MSRLFLRFHDDSFDGFDWCIVDAEEPVEKMGDRVEGLALISLGQRFELPKGLNPFSVKLFEKDADPAPVLGGGFVETLREFRVFGGQGKSLLHMDRAVADQLVAVEESMDLP